MPEQSFPSPRRRGAPLGNTNALKHGFYSRRFKRTDIKDLDACEFSGLKDEITMLRVYIRRVIEMSNGMQDFYESMTLLRVLCLASDSLTRLLKTQNLLITPGSETETLLLGAINDVQQEWAAQRQRNEETSALQALEEAEPDFDLTRFTPPPSSST